MAKLDLLILDELGYVPASKAGAELLFDVIATAYERQSVIVTSNLPFENWTEVLGNERLTGAALDRLTHRCHILETKRRELPAAGRQTPTARSGNDLTRTNPAGAMPAGYEPKEPVDLVLHNSAAPRYTIHPPFRLTTAVVAGRCGLRSQGSAGDVETQQPQ